MTGGAFAACAAVTALGVAAVMRASFTGSRTLHWVAKPVASAGFVAAALPGALDGAFGRAMLAALCLSWLGDVLLIPKDRGAFAAGLFAFLLGHVAYAWAFLARGVDPATTGIAGLGLAAAAWAVARALLPKVPPPLKAPVAAYIAVVTAMVALAVGAAGAGAGATIPLAALAFYVSDLAVARERFVSPDPWNRAVGLPLYYGAQLAFAWVAAGG